MGPGPSNPYPEVMEAFTRPVLGHLDPDFISLLDETNERLKQVWQTQNSLTFPVSATGSAGMEWRHNSNYASINSLAYVIIGLSN